MSFSSWSALVADVKDALASGDWRTREFDIDGLRRSFSSLKETTDFLEYCEYRAQREADSSSSIARGRVYAKGTWS
jgi:hypothetical protein